MKRCCKRGRAFHGPCPDRRTLEFSTRSSKQKRPCCKKGRALHRPYLNKSPLDSSPRSSAQKKSCCQGKKVVHRPRLDKSPLDSSPRSSEQRQSQKMLFFCFQSRCTATYGPKVEQPEFLLAQKAVPKTDDSRRTWLILLIHIDRRPNYLHTHSEIIGMTAQSGASTTVDCAQKRHCNLLIRPRSTRLHSTTSRRRRRSQRRLRERRQSPFPG